MLRADPMAKKVKATDPPPRLIAVEGPIGVGKTTLAQHLAREIGARLIVEEIEENPFIRGFYQDPQRTAFQTQMFFLLSRYRQQTSLRQEDLFVRATVLDYLFQKDRIFALLTLSDEELALYERVYDALDPRVPVPDLVVYLQCRPDVLVERIRMRNREWERPMKVAYIEEVVRLYNEFFFRWKASPLLIINTSDIDFVENEEHLNAVLAQIRRMKKGTQFVNPT